MDLLRRRRVPDVVRALALPPGDRRVAWALTADGEPVVATTTGVLLPGRDHIPWSAVERVAWQRPLLTVVELEPTAAPVSGSGRSTRVRLADDDGDLPAAVHSGVTSSVAWSQHVRLGQGGGVRVVGRRTPGSDELSWQTVFDAGTDVHDPDVRAQAAALVARSRRTIG